jgi:hypothetical protein
MRHKRKAVYNEVEDLGLRLTVNTTQEKITAAQRLARAADEMSDNREDLEDDVGVEFDVPIAVMTANVDSNTVDHESESSNIQVDDDPKVRPAKKSKKQSKITRIN